MRRSHHQVTIFFKKFKWEGKLLKADFKPSSSFMKQTHQGATSEATSEQFHSTFHKCSRCTSPPPPTPRRQKAQKEYFRKLEIAVWQEFLISVQPIVECVKVMDENSLSAFPLLAFTTFPIRTETHAAVLTLIEPGLNWRQSHGNSTLFKIHTYAFLYSDF